MSWEFLPGLCEETRDDMDGEEMADVLGRLAALHRAPGAALAIRTRAGTAITTVGGTGTGRPVEQSSVFPFGSVTKAFTATVAMQVVSDGDLALDGPVADSIPEFADPVDPALRRITLRQLLTHTSGLPSDHEIAGTGPVSPRRYAASVAKLSTVGTPGEVFSYSNTGYVLVGHLIELATGQSWWDCMTSFLAKPAGMGLVNLDAPGSRETLVTAHAVRGDSRVPVDIDVAPGWSPAAGLAGGVEDLVALAEVHLGGRGPGLLAAGDAVRMRTPDRAADAFGMAAGWAPGWALYSGPTGTWFGHDGVVAGTTCSVRADPATGTVVALLTNATSGLALWSDLVDELRSAGIGVGDYSPPAGPPESGTAAPVEYVGDYRNGLGTFRVRVDGTYLHLDDGTGFEARLCPAGGDTFLAHRLDEDQPPHLGRFLRDHDTGHVNALQFSGRVSILDTQRGTLRLEQR